MCHNIVFIMDVYKTVSLSISGSMLIKEHHYIAHFCQMFFRLIQAKELTDLMTVTLPDYQTCS
jgi:hypothetical protein